MNRPRKIQLCLPAKNGSTTPARQYSEISATQMERREELLLRPKLLKQTTVVESPPQTPRHSDHFSM